MLLPGQLTYYSHLMSEAHPCHAYVKTQGFWLDKQRPMLSNLFHSTLLASGDPVGLQHIQEP